MGVLLPNAVRAKKISSGPRERMHCRWTTAKFMDEIMDITKHISGAPMLHLMEDGFNQLWEKMVVKHKMNIVYNVDVEQVERSENGVKITVRFLCRISLQKHQNSCSILTSMLCSFLMGDGCFKSDLLGSLA